MFYDEMLLLYLSRRSDHITMDTVTMDTVTMDTVTMDSVTMVVVANGCCNHG